MKKYIFIFFLSLSFMSFSCGPDEIIDPSTEDTFLSATINGEEFLVRGIVVTASQSTIDGMMRNLSIGAAKQAANGDTKGIALAMISADSTEFKSGEVYNAISLSKRGAGEHFIDEGSSKISASSHETDIATITITEIDLTKKIVSGTFSFDAIDDDEPGKLYEVRDGIFNKVPIIN
jgi:hypothetical protein